MIRIRSMGLAFRDRPVARLASILEAWEGTPYSKTEHRPGVGVSCAGFLCAVLDGLYGNLEPTLPPDTPPDAQHHDRATAMRGMRWFLERYPAHVKVSDGVVEPGDILVTGPVCGGPGHGMLVGPDGCLWHVSGTVARTGRSLPHTYQLFAVYRMTDRERWSST